MASKLINIHDLQLWPDNYNEGDVGAIATSIETFGFNGVFKQWQGITMCGNHSLKALWSLYSRGPLDPEDQPPDYEWPPVGITERNHRWYISPKRIIALDHLTEIQATAYALADNRTAQLASQNQKLLAEYLKKLSQHNDKVFAATGYDQEDLEMIVGGLALDDAEQISFDDTTGELLGKLRLADLQPRHTCQVGQVWTLGGHVLIVAGVIEDWPSWVGYLHDDVLFCPHPSPLVTLTPKAQVHPLLLVTPDPWIAAHILDRYEDIYGKKKIKLQA